MKLRFLQGLTILSGLIVFSYCSPKDKTTSDLPENDTIQVLKLVVQDLKAELTNFPGIDSVTEIWEGNYCSVHYRIDKILENSQTISVMFGDFDGDNTHDAIATIEYNTGGNRPEFKHIPIRHSPEGYQLLEALPLFGYRYIDLKSIHDGFIELTGKTWTKDDPMCCPSIINALKVKLVGDAFELIEENTLNTNDPIVAEFENAKYIADSIKKKFLREKQKLFKISHIQKNQQEDSESSSTWYFDSNFTLACFEELSVFTGGSGDKYCFYEQEELILEYYITTEAGDLFTDIWFNQHKLSEVIYSSGDKKYGNIIVPIENDLRNRWKEFTEDQSKHEFTYDSGSSCYKLSKANTDWWEELRLDSELFVQL